MKKVKKKLSVLFIVICTGIFLSCTNLYQNILRKDRAAVNLYRVVFDQNGGLGGPDFITAAFGQKLPDLDEAAPVNGNAYFDGYYDKTVAGNRYYDEQLKSVAVWDKATDSVLFARWIAQNERKIAFYANNGTSQQEVFTVKKDEIITIPEPSEFSFLYDSHKFIGWNTQKNGTGTAYAAGSDFTVSEHSELYAQWEGSYSITYFINGVEEIGFFPDVFTRESLPLRLATIPEENGYVVSGWYAESDCSGTPVTEISAGSALENKTFYAKKEVVYTVNFDANGGFGSMEAQKFYGGETKQLSSHSFTYSDREFIGWTDFQSSKEAKYENGADFTANKNLTLYAVWAKTEFTQSDYDNPNFTEFDVYTAKQLASIAFLTNEQKNNFVGKTIVLHSDVDFAGTDFNGISSGNNYSDEVSLGFKGVFDGNGYVIKNLHISRPDKTDVGFIGYAAEGSIIKNLGIDSSSKIEGATNVGGIAGSSSGSIENCYNAATVTGKTEVGGIVGSLYNGVVKNSYNIGKVTARSGGSIVGQVISGSVSNSYYLEQSVTADTGAEKTWGTNLGAAEFANQSRFSGWDFTAVWEMKIFTDLSDIVNGVSERPILRQK